MEIKTYHELTLTNLAELQGQLAAHLRDNHLSLVVDRGRHFLSMPGHHQFSFSPCSPRRTGSIFYEETTTLVLDYLLKRMQPSHFFDIGAGDGYFARVAASLRGPGPHVDAFEMRNSAISAARRTLEGAQFAPRINLHATSVSDRDAENVKVWQARSLLFEEPPLRREYEESWWRRAKFWLRRDRSRGLETVLTSLTSIDGFARRTHRRPDIIKIDVEGYEGKVLQGATQTLRVVRPFILLELHKDERQRFGMRRRDIANLLFEHGYEALLFTDHQNARHCEVLRVRQGDAVIARQETDMFLFAPRE
jgi:FkbM family methyltransferase